MVFVFRLGAELAHAPLLVPAEHLQQPPVLHAHSVGEVLHRRDQLVKLQGGDSLVRLQVRLAVRGQTDQAGLDGFHLQARGGADITHYLAGKYKTRISDRLSRPKVTFWYLAGGPSAHVKIHNQI